MIWPPLRIKRSSPAWVCRTRSSCASDGRDCRHPTGGARFPSGSVGVRSSLDVSAVNGRSPKRRTWPSLARPSEYPSTGSRTTGIDVSSGSVFGRLRLTRVERDLTAPDATDFEVIKGRDVRANVDGNEV